MAEEDNMEVFQTLSVMFPQCGRQQIQDCVMEVLATLTDHSDRERLLNRCIDRLLSELEIQPDPGNARDNSVVRWSPFNISPSVMSPNLNVAGPSQVHQQLPQTYRFNEAYKAVVDPLDKNEIVIPAGQPVNIDMAMMEDFDDVHAIPPEVVSVPQSEPSLDEQMALLVNLYPDVEPTFMQNLLTQGHFDLQVAADWIANQPKAYVPRRPKATKPAAVATEADVMPAEKDCDAGDDAINIAELSLWQSWREYDAANYFDPNYNALERSSYEYISDAIRALATDFPELALNDLRVIMRLYNNKFGPAKKALREAINVFLTENEGVTSLTQKRKTSISLGLQVNDAPVRQIHVKVLGSRRHSIADLSRFCPALAKEVQWVRYKPARDAQLVEIEVQRRARHLQEEQKRQEQLAVAREIGDVFECSICAMEVLFNELVQCLDGHTFCADCLRNYAKESVYGHGKSILLCLDSQCDYEFGRTTLEKALPKEMLAKLDERAQQENLSIVNMTDLYRCACGYAAVPEASAEVDKVFRCAQCSKETCRICANDWDELHFGKSCKEMETKDEERLRKEYEEKMAAAIIRQCEKCKTPMVKEEGCNKMTCRCGATLCYLCKKSGIDYSHFCRHPLEPGKPCNQCDSCLLWEKPELRDKKALEVIEKEKVEETRKRQAESEEPNNNKSKRMQTAQVEQPQPVLID